MAFPTSWLRLPFSALEWVDRSLEHRPLAKCCLAFIAGSALSVTPHQFSRVIPFEVLAGVLAAAVLRSMHATSGSSAPERSIVTPIAGAACLLGYALSARALAPAPDDVSGWASPHLARLVGTAVNELVHHENHDFFELECSEVWLGDAAHRVRGRVLVDVPSFGYHRQADVADWPDPGQGVEVRGILRGLDPGASSYDEKLVNRGIFAVFEVAKGGFLSTTTPREFSFSGGCRAVRDWMLEGLSFIPSRQFALLAGMLFHKKEGIDPLMLNEMQQIGVIHILASAGLHVGLYLLAIRLFLGAVLPRRTTAVLAMLLLLGYCVACGGWPAVTRATVMAELVLLASLCGRMADPLTCLSLSASLMLAANPLALLDQGVQFTFLTVAVVCLLLTDEPDRSHPRGADRLLSGWSKIFRLSLGAQLGSGPLTLYYYGFISVVGVLANLVIVPLMMLAFPVAIVTSLLWRLSHAAGVMLGWVLNFLLWAIVNLSRTMAHWPFAVFNRDGAEWPLIVALYSLLFSVAAWRRRRSEQRQFLLGVTTPAMAARLSAVGEIRGISGRHDV